MHRETNRLSVLFVALTVGLLGIVSIAQARGAIAAATDVLDTCQLTLDSETVRPSPDPVVLRAVFSEPIGEELVAEIQEESGLKVVKVEREADEPLAIKLTLDAKEAASGEWTLALAGENGRCTGKVKVQAAEPQDT
ncbi:MAG TPA: hypothetical protein VKZ58_08450 [Longimicrobiales bacterium]|nr:hypothetical protein [Longimicrobiales bacterium]